MNTIFENRFHAGEILADRLQGWSVARPVILALPRGGVPVAFEIAKRLKAELDLLLVKKIGAPGREELAMGAIAEGGEPYWNQEVLDYFPLSAATLDSLAERKRLEIEKQSQELRGGRGMTPVEGRVVILVDDGLATGATMISAVQILRQRRPEKIIVAVPVASTQARETISELADETVALMTPEPFESVGQWYKDFNQVEDEEVRELLARHAKEPFELDIEIPAGRERLPGRLSVPVDARALIIFAHGSGSTHQSPRNTQVAQALHRLGFATLLFDLLTEVEAANRANVFDIPLLSKRLRLATEWAAKHPQTGKLPIAYFGASTGAAAALTAAALDPLIFAVVSRGGRPDMAEASLPEVQAPTLLIVGGADAPVIPLNRSAHSLLPNSELAIVPGAGHLFEGPGQLQEVIELAGNWFLECLDPKQAAEPKPHEQILAELRSVARPFERDADLDALAEKMSGSRVVMMGEATHGTEEFYEIRRLLSQKLIENHGFHFIAVEGDWPDCARFNSYIHDGRQAPAQAERIMEGFQRWPTWMWGNRQTAQLIEWMKPRGASFYGLDVYSLYESLRALREYAVKTDPSSARSIQTAFRCFEPYERSEISYASTLYKLPAGCRDEALDLLRRLARTRLEETSLSAEELFDARQNAYVVRNAERYYRAMMEGRSESWNVRDEHMMDTLSRLLEQHGEGARAIVWAHNTHIGDYHATDMIEEGYVNLGGLARERYGRDNVFLLGFGTYQGEVIAGQAWEAPPQVMRIAPAQEGSYEDYLHRMAAELECNRFSFLMNGGLRLPSLKVTRGHRAIGVVYHPRFESKGHNYVPTELADRYDGFIFVDRTTALRTAAPRAPDKGLLPETWPAGV